MMLCWGRAMPDAGHAGHLPGDTALILCPALSQPASYSIPASCRFDDVEVHKFSLKPQGTKGRGLWDNFSYNKRLLNLKAFFSMNMLCLLNIHRVIMLTS